MLRFCISVLLSTCFILVPLASLSAQTDSSGSDVVKDDSTEINVKNADLESLVRIFSKKTKRNYILDERVKGTVSIYLPGKVSSEEAIYILDSVLALKGFTTVPIGDNLWKIIPAKDAKQTTVPLVGETEGRGTAAVVTRFINLKYVAADDVKQLISSLVSSYGLISAYTGTNSLILIDSEDNIKRLMQIIENLDLPSSDSEMAIIPVHHASAIDLAEKINEILGGDDQQSTTANIPNTNANRVTNARAAARRASANNTAATSNSATSVTVSMRGRQPKIIADERTNSIIVVADDETTARIKALVEQLDSQVDLSGNSFHVYRCQHASAEELAEVLSGLAGGGSGTGSASSLGGTTRSNLRSESAQDRLESQRRTPGQSRNNTSNNNGGVSSVSLGENISITADPATNSLIIVASQSDYQKVSALLAKLDIKRRQVIVEAVIMEVAVDDNKSLGTEFSTAGGGSDGGILATNNFGNLTSLLSDPRQLQDFSFAAASAGTLTLPGGIAIPTQSVLVRATQNNSSVNVLSAPTILATDNEDAEIIVGSNIPFISSTASNQTDLNNVFNQVDRQDVGITLRITPQISSSDFVTLKMFTEVSNVIPGTESSALGPTTTVRTSETVVITKDSQMVVIGGLMADNITESERGIPFLKDVPVFGGLFKTTTETQQRTNLLIFITPRIVKDQFDARDISLEEREELKEIIQSYKIYPDRREVLEDKAFDNVIDGQVYEGAKPSTVRPKKSKQVVEPILLPEPELNQPEYRSSLNSGAMVGAGIGTGIGAGVNSGSGRHVVFEIASSLPGGVWPEFIANSSEGLVGVALPESVSATASNFFASDRKYNYTNGSQRVMLNVIGVFDSKQAASQYYPSLNSNWHKLAPFEIINLGKAPWTVAEGSILQDSQG